MLHSYLKIAWRNLRKQPGFTVVNVVGLSAGLACFALIALWVNDELSYDTFHQHYARIVRVTSLKQTETGVVESARTPAPLAKAIQQQYAEVANTVRLLSKREEIVQYNGQQTLQSDIVFTEPSFFEVFSYGLLRGNPATALKDPYSVVLTESTAKRYFGNADPMGQVITIFMYDSTGRGAAYKVTGVTPDPPPNAHFSFTMLGSFRTIEVARPDVVAPTGWDDNRFYTYLLLNDAVNTDAFATKITQLRPTYARSLAPTDHVTYRLQPLADIHLRSQAQHELSPTGSMGQLSVFSTIGLLILLLAGINYTNLTTARSVARAKEIGVKKVVGALRTQLMAQHLTESVVVALLALVLSWLITVLTQPIFGQLTGKHVALFASPTLPVFLTATALLLGVLSGLYPAFVLSSLEPVRVLKGAFQAGTKGAWLRKTLVVVQFVITVVLISAIVIIHAQMTFISNRNLGYNKDALVYLRVNGNTDVINGYNAFRNELAAGPLIGGIATSNSLPLGGLETSDAETVGPKGQRVSIHTATLSVDADYLSVYGIQVVAGRNFTRRAATDTIRPVLINETAVKRLGWRTAGNAIGKPFRLDGRPGVVIGVVRDFHVNTLQHAIEPVAIGLRDEHFSRITVKINPANAREALAFIKRVWAAHFPIALFDYGFLDEQLDSQYRTEERFSTLITYFSTLSLLIACLGLYGLVAYATAQKTKEIGIRKIVGATVSGLVLMLSKDFLKLVGIACLVAIPITWYLMQAWLQQFAYKITIAWWMFALAELLAITIALLTVSFQSIRAALMNPVKSLHIE